MTEHIEEHDSVQVDMPFSAASLLAWRASTLTTQALVTQTKETLDDVKAHLGRLNGHIFTLMQTDGVYDKRISILEVQTDAQTKLAENHRETEMRRQEKGMDRWINIGVGLANALILLAVLFVLGTIVKNMVSIPMLVP